MNPIHTLLIAGLLSASASIVVAQNPATEKNGDYAITPEPKATAAFANVKIDPSTINVLSASFGKLGKNLESTFANHMNLWVKAKNPGTCDIEWKIQAPADGLYDVNVVVLSNGSLLTLTHSGQKLQATSEEKKWERLDLGQIRL